MKKGWEIKRLGEVCELMNGYAFQSKQYTNEGFFVIRIGNVQDGYIELNNPRYIKLKEEKQKKFILQSGDILISLTGNVGRVGVIQEEHLPAVLNQRVAKISIKKELKTDKEYLLYFLTSEYFISELIKAGRGAAQQNISTTDIENLEIPLPPLSEQQRIVSILDEAFTAIAKAKANAELNLKNTKELFESYLQEALSHKGDDWEEKRLGEIIDFFNGFAFKSSDAVEMSNTQLLRMGNLYQNNLSLERSPVFYPDKFIDTYSKYLLKENDLIISLTGTTGKEDYGYAVKIPKTEKSLLLNQRISKIIIKDVNKISQDYLFHFLHSRLFLDILYSTANGTRQANLSTETMKGLEFSFPNYETQKVIVQKLDALSLEAKKLEVIYQRKLDDLEELKKSILQKAFAGELKTEKVIAV